MGCTGEQRDQCYDDERPVRNVTVSDFYIGKYEVTQAQWVAVMGSNPSHFYGDNLPVEEVSWDDAQEFIQALNSITGRRYRLPTEAEWEYAARGGSLSRGYMFAGSNNPDDVGWHSGNSGGRTQPVGTKMPNELGIYDMSGNVREWVSDWLGTYGSFNETNPRGPSSGTHRAGRGGSWDVEIRRCRVSNRISGTPPYRPGLWGVRLALSP
jgi:formylglycine-generating enzyme required for sulfatase activity